MTPKCDHGITLDRYCGDCEAGFAFFDDTPDTRETSRLVSLACTGLLLLVVLVAFAVKGGPR